jgi:hypothetical protein
VLGAVADRLRLAQKKARLLAARWQTRKPEAAAALLRIASSAEEADRHLRLLVQV